MHRPRYRLRRADTPPVRSRRRCDSRGGLRYRHSGKLLVRETSCHPRAGFHRTPEAGQGRTPPRFSISIASRTDPNRASDECRHYRGDGNATPLDASSRTEIGCGGRTRTCDHRINNSAFVSGPTRISPLPSMFTSVRTRPDMSEGECVRHALDPTDANPYHRKVAPIWPADPLPVLGGVEVELRVTCRTSSNQIHGAGGCTVINTHRTTTFDMQTPTENVDDFRARSTR